MSATGDGNTVVILATQRSSCLQGKGGTFISQLFKDPQNLLVQPDELNP